MNREFRDVVKTFLPNAWIVIDRFHVGRYCTEAMGAARRSIQSCLPNLQRRYFKRSRCLFLAHRKDLSQEERNAVDGMIHFSDKRMQAYTLKEMFFECMDAPDRNEADRCLEMRLDICDRLKLPEFRARCRMLRNRRAYILNIFDIHLSNGFTEGCYDAIKTFKRLAFGFRNFDTFRVEEPCPKI